MKVYAIGDYVIKANDGVCKVEDILHLDIPDTDKNKLYYLLIPVADKGGKLYLSTEKADQNLRKVLSEREAWEVIKKIPDIEAMWIENDKLREQKYKEAIQSCDPVALVGIIKTLYLRKQKRIKQGKKNTATDERYFQMAEDQLYAELAVAIGKEKKEIGKIITDTINQKKDE